MWFQEKENPKLYSERVQKSMARYFVTLVSAIIVQTKCCSLTDQISAGKTFFPCKGTDLHHDKIIPFLLSFVFFWGGVVGGTESSDIFLKKKFKLALVNFMLHNRF